MGKHAWGEAKKKEDIVVCEGTPPEAECRQRRFCFARCFEREKVGREPCWLSPERALFQRLPLGTPRWGQPTWLLLLLCVVMMSNCTFLYHRQRTRRRRRRAEGRRGACTCRAALCCSS
eukprot:TRINITY_DN2162_c1_g1_i9.p2 TRINITY_DN2162_c1_g1~~TRINITY_DN2162_c1_g1_i9.p2  ORF type:complete len:119 (-),score=20.04 TRINITY_DN2162_c1_g1_i9:182-538(-)